LKAALVRTKLAGLTSARLATLIKQSRKTCSSARIGLPGTSLSGIIKLRSKLRALSGGGEAVINAVLIVVTSR